MSTLHEDVFIFIAKSLDILLRMRNLIGKNCIKNKNTRFTFSDFSRKSCRLWDNVETYGGAREVTNDDTVWRIRVACWISKATRARACIRSRLRTAMRTRARTHAQRKICNTYCFCTATKIRERASILRYSILSVLFVINPATKCHHWFIRGAIFITEDRQMNEQSL